MNLGFLKDFFWVFVVLLGLSYFVGQNIQPQLAIEKVTLDIKKDDNGQLFYKYKGKPKYINEIVDIKKHI